MTPTEVQREPTTQRPSSLWLFNAPLDLAAFLGSGVLSLALLGWGYAAGLLNDDTPEWVWVPVVLLLDVAHVYATGFRVYFDRDELARRPLLYFGVPVIAFAVGWALYAESTVWFWRALAYFAVFHFVRQQYGWVAMYRAKRDEKGALGKWIDTGAIYLAAIYPLIHWHAHLPRNFWWFRDGDFQALPTIAARAVFPVYVVAMTAYACRAFWLWKMNQANPGKDVVVVTTAICWYVGIVAFNSDYAFTVTNVIIHGVPYLVLTYWYWSKRTTMESDSSSKWLGRVAMFLGVVWMLAYAEELLWDHTAWGERAWLFGASDESWRSWRAVFVPLLAVPQITHYALDGFIWRRKSNPSLEVL